MHRCMLGEENVVSRWERIDCLATSFTLWLNVYHIFVCFSSWFTPRLFTRAQSGLTRRLHLIQLLTWQCMKSGDNTMQRLHLPSTISSCQFPLKLSLLAIQTLKQRVIQWDDSIAILTHCASISMNSLAFSSYLFLPVSGQSFFTLLSLEALFLLFQAEQSIASSNRATIFVHDHGWSFCRANSWARALGLAGNTKSPWHMHTRVHLFHQLWMCNVRKGTYVYIYRAGLQWWEQRIDKLLGRLDLL